MKTRTILMLLAAMAAVAAAPKEPAKAPEAPLPYDPNARAEVAKEFRASRVGTPGAAGIETRARLVALHQALGGDPAEARGVKLALTVKGSYASGGGLVYVATDARGTRYAVIALATGLDIGSALAGVFEPAGVFQATVTTGSRAGERLPLYKELAPAAGNTITQAQLVTRLKAGQSFKVVMFEKGACEACFGRGNLSALKGGGRCPDCGGTGNALVTYTLKW